MCAGGVVASPLVAVAALVLLALPAGMLVTGRLINRAPAATQPAIGFGPSPSASVTANPSPTPQASDAPSQAATPEPGVPIAVVTAAGDGLRVRSRPEVSADSKKLAPLLAAGSRMLVVNGPVPADGYDWYEVRADNDLFGWVAAGKDGERLDRAGASQLHRRPGRVGALDRRPDRLLRAATATRP